MREVTYGGAISLDGFLAGRDEALDWLRWSDEAAAIARESFRGVDSILVGRKTFEAGLKMGGAPRMGGVTTYVFSRTLKALPDGADGELVGEDVVDFVRRMKRGPGGRMLVMGGGELGSALLAAGLVDEIGFSIHPILLGGGVPAFRSFEDRVELELIEARAMERGCVLVRHRVLNAAERGADRVRGEAGE